MKIADTPTADLIAELKARLNNGDFVRAERQYAPLARLILSEEAIQYPDLMDPPQEGTDDA